MERTLLVVGLVALCALAGYGLYVGWRHRAARQSGLAALPVAPADLGPDLVEPVTGLYISTTTAGNWQDRIVAAGPRPARRRGGQAVRRGRLHRTRRRGRHLRPGRRSRRGDRPHPGSPAR